MNKIETRCSVTMPGVVSVINRIDEFCMSYGLYAKLIDFSDAYLSYESGIYVVVSDRPIVDDVNPYHLILRNKRNPGLLFLHDFAIRLTSSNAMVAFYQIMDFCKKSELIHTLYQEFSITIPDAIHTSLFEYLRGYHDGRFAMDKTEAYRTACRDALANYFLKEKQNQKSRTKHKKNYTVIPLSELLEDTDAVSKLEVPEELYGPFLTYLNKCYPDVSLSVSKKEIVDTGLLSVMKKRSKQCFVNGKEYVTAEQLYETLRKNFASEGWSCIENMEAAYWEYRYVYYKQIDEPYILEAYFALCFEFAQADSLFSLKEKGTLCKVTLPISWLYDFVAFAKRNHIRFYLDNRGQFAELDANNVTIIINKSDERRTGDFLGSLVN